MVSAARPSLMFSFAVLLAFLAVPAFAQDPPVTVTPDWNKVAAISKASVSIEVCVEPPLRRGYPIHDQLFRALHDLGADYAHYQPWNVFPRLGVAELKPPAGGKTYWDFTLIDQITEDFMRATAGHPVVFNFGSLPAWMFSTSAPAPPPENPDEIDWNYSEFNARQLNDASLQLAADYQARLASWYINGGFKDEYGAWHESGHHYDIAYWEILNDPDFEGSLGPADYTRLYDAIVEAVRKVAPRMKFMGPVVGDPGTRADYFVYFLDPKNHKPGIPIDMLSYHLYSMPDADESQEIMTYTVFQQAEKFLTTARYIDAIRLRFAPLARTDVVDVATMLPDPLAPKLAQPIPPAYWMRSGALFAYLYGRFAVMGIDVVGGSELIDYPGMAAASTLVDWDSGQPNARYWVLKLLRENFGPGDKLIASEPYTVLQPDPAPQLYFQGFITPQGQRKILLVNKREKPVTITIPSATNGQLQQVDQSLTSSPPSRQLAQDSFSLPPLAVAVVTLPR
ncbi:MAG: hypothetical protein WB987_07600 [Candidatus Acidiferrales bacterium]